MASPPKSAVKAAPKPKAAKAVKDPSAPKPARNMDALQKPLTPSPELAEIVGKDMLPRGQVVSKVWDYIRTHNLQNPADKREILADEKLKKVFGRDKCTMFEMNKYLAQHLK
jgi:chromatin remodeling complex protein RSC6